MRLPSNCRKGRARQHQQAADCLQYNELLLQGLVDGIGAGSRPVQGHGRGSVGREVILQSSKRGSEGEKGTGSGRLIFVRTGSGSGSGSGSLQWNIIPQGLQSSIFTPHGPHQSLKFLEYWHTVTPLRTRLVTLTLSC
jgi:hypothetical protein